MMLFTLPRNCVLLCCIKLPAKLCCCFHGSLADILHYVVKSILSGMKFGHNIYLLISDSTVFCRYICALLSYL